MSTRLTSPISKKPNNDPLKTPPVLPKCPKQTRKKQRGYKCVLPEAIFSHARSFLDIFEIHRTRAVCKEWNDISNIRSYIDLVVDDDNNRIPDHVDLGKVVSLKLSAADRDCVGEFLMSLLIRTHMTLEILNIDEIHDVDYFTSPILPKLDQLTIRECSEKLFSALINKSPRCRRLSIIRWRNSRNQLYQIPPLKISLDFNKLTFLRRLFFGGNILLKFENIGNCKLEYLDCRANDMEENFKQFSKFKSVETIVLTYICCSKFLKYFLHLFNDKLKEIIMQVIYDAHYQCSPRLYLGKDNLEIGFFQKSDLIDNQQTLVAKEIDAIMDQHPARLCGVEGMEMYQFYMIVSILFKYMAEKVGDDCAISEENVLQFLSVGTKEYRAIAENLDFMD